MLPFNSTTFFLSSHLLSTSSSEDERQQAQIKDLFHQQTTSATGTLNRSATYVRVNVQQRPHAIHTSTIDRRRVPDRVVANVELGREAGELSNEPDVGDVVVADGRLGRAAAEVVLPRALVRAVVEDVQEVRPALVRLGQLEPVLVARERQQNLRGVVIIERRMQSH